MATNDRQRGQRAREREREQDRPQERPEKGSQRPENRAPVPDRSEQRPASQVRPIESFDPRRQSAPRENILDTYGRMMAQQMDNVSSQPQNGAIDGFSALNAPIGKEAIHKATQILQKYKEGKANLERRVIDNDQWYKLRHWENLRHSKPEQVEPVSAWLFNCIETKHADAMDNYPAPNVLPREEGDKGEAEMLSSIIPVILDQCDFEQVYDEVTRNKLKGGTGIYGVFWDSTKLNGLGDISVKKIDIVNLFWEPGITDIQASRNVFHVDLVDNEQLVGQYPQLAGKLSNSTIDIAKYVYDDSVDTTEKSVVVDWYYKKFNRSGKQVLHYCKYVNDQVLFATENDTQPKVDPTGMAVAEPMSETGFYNHGQFPFIFDPLFQIEGTPAGFGYIDVGKSAQEFIDRGNQAIMKSMLVNARPRYFIRGDGSVNEKEYADITNDFIHVDGNLGTDSILPVQNTPFSSVWVDIIQYKVDELKETTGNRDVSNGGTTGGATAASAIAAMIESGSKLSRDSNKASYRAFRKIVLLCIELIRQFYDLPRCFRIMGANGVQRFVMYSNAGIAPQMQGIEFGVDMGMRIPLFDVQVTAEKASPYSRMAQNELALQFYGAGFFNPQMADQALLCLGMMDFDGKDELMSKIQQQGGMLQQMMMLAQMYDQAAGTGGEVTASLMAQYGMGGATGGSSENNQQSSSGGQRGGESPITAKAREKVAESTVPR